MSAGVRRVADLLDDVFSPWVRGRSPKWPPDAFAVAACLLKHSGAYTEIVHEWPPEGYSEAVDWQKFIETTALDWKTRYKIGKPRWPVPLQDWWETIIFYQDLAIADIRSEWSLVVSLAGIVATADQACRGFGSLKAMTNALEELALNLLRERGTLCRTIHRSRVTVLPKLHNPLDGLTMRSLTHNLALWDRSEVAAEWSSLSMRTTEAGLNLLVLPWPLEVDPASFKNHHVAKERMPPQFGFFTYDMTSHRVDARRVLRLKDQAEAAAGGPIAAVVFPELSMSFEDFIEVQRALRDTVLIAGIGESPEPGEVGKNYVGIAGSKADVYARNFQYKHHRWRLDPAQIAQYQGALGNKASWWEAISIPERVCTFVDVEKWLTFCVLICEDLARQDPVAELVRSVGPNLVIALLMDGPQLQSRWSGRYATVLADDPRSSVLTLTCAGMVDLSNEAYRRVHGGPAGKRSIGLWKDAKGGQTEIALDLGAVGMVLQLKRSSVMEWVADGRDDGNTTGYLELLRTDPLFEKVLTGSAPAGSKRTRRSGKNGSAEKR